MPMLAAGAALGAALAYFLDPQNGGRRRHVTRDRTLALIRRGRRGEQTTHLREQPNELDDVMLACKVTTELFRSADVPEGSIDVNVDDGVVQLRGEVGRPKLVQDAVETARSVQGVRYVENSLHLPGTRAPTHR